MEVFTTIGIMRSSASKYSIQIIASINKNNNYTQQFHSGLSVTKPMSRYTIVPLHYPRKRWLF